MSRPTIRPRGATRTTAARADAARLDRLIEEATVDCFRCRVRHQREPSGSTPTDDGSEAAEVSLRPLPAAGGIDGI